MTRLYHFMENEQTNKTDTQGKEADKPTEEKKPISIVDEARAIRDDIQKQKEELKAENDRKQKIQSEELLGSSAGGHVEAKQMPPETPQEYAKKVISGELNDKRT